MAKGLHVNDNVLSDIVFWLLLLIVVGPSATIRLAFGVRGEVIVVEDLFFRRGWRLTADILIVLVAEKVVTTLIHGVNGIL
jgi:hypothetical protein